MTPAPFLAQLAAAVTDLRATVGARFAALPLSALNQRQSPASWSILECLEHLNRYSRYYNAAFAHALARPRPAPVPPAEIAYTWLGRKSVEMMRPTTAKKTTTLKRFNPLGSSLGGGVLLEFDQHQARLLQLLAQARPADLNRRQVPVEFFRLWHLRLGEALEFVVVHQQRHVQQALRTQEAL